MAAAERSSIRSAVAPLPTRAFAVVTGTAGLVLVGVLMLTVTPRRGESPIAVGASTTVISAPVQGVLRSPPLPGIRTTTETSLRAARQHALATPIGVGNVAVMTRSGAELDASQARGEEFDVQLSSGQVVAAEVIDETVDGVVVVTIAMTEPGHDIASEPPSPDAIVTVLADPPVTVAFADVASVGAPDGTPVIDADGSLVGLCTRAADRTSSMVDVTGEFPHGEEPAATTEPEAVNDDLVVATTAVP